MWSETLYCPYNIDFHTKTQVCNLFTFPHSATRTKSHILKKSTISPFDLDLKKIQIKGMREKAFNLEKCLHN